MCSDFKDLPESLEKNELEPYFNEFLNTYSSKSLDIEALQELYELAYRQWDTYEMLDKNISERIEEYIINSINFESFEMMDIIISITENLTLKNLYTFIINHNDNVRNVNVKRLLNEMQDEYGENLKDPY